MQAMDYTGAARVEKFLVVVQIEAVEIGALAAFNLLDSQDLAPQKLYRLAGARLHDEFIDDVAPAHDRCLIFTWLRRFRWVLGREFPQGAADQSKPIDRMAVRNGVIEQFQLLLID
jgi:hypothetical protein